MGSLSGTLHIMAGRHTDSQRGRLFPVGMLSRMAPGSEMVRMLLMTGFCGGFTTFSTFTNESLLMLRTGQLLPLALYAGGSLVLGLCAAALGYKCM